METINVTHARADLFNLVDSVAHGEPRRITSKRGDAVMVSLDEWEGLQETLLIMSDKNLARELKNRMNTPTSECIDELNW